MYDYIPNPHLTLLIVIGLVEFMQFRVTDSEILKPCGAYFSFNCRKSLFFGKFRIMKQNESVVI